MNEIQTIPKSAYPDTLRNMKYPPRKLYFRGSFPAPVGHRYLCVIGSRKWTPYGRDAVGKIISGLKGYPISIVSGLAIGIDSIAHMAALEAGLHCVAFPGSSLEWDKIYPPTHLNLAKKIVENGGALVSRWEIDYPMGSWAFPARNVLMAGLSHAVLIVEAGYRSGSLMTAKHAEEFDRDVLAIPGSIFSSTSYGPHMLIKSGAVPVSSSEEVLEELGFGVIKRDYGLLSNLKVMEPITKKVIDALSIGEMTADLLSEKTGIGIGDLNHRLSLLELGGFISIDGGMIRALTGY